MALSYAEAAERITEPGERFETVAATIDGVDVTVFRNAPATVRDIFDTARSRGDEIFLVYEDERWSFGRVMTEVDALAAVLVQRYGVRHGDRVAISMRNYPEWVVSWAAALSVGAVAVSLNAWWTADEIDYALDDATPKLLIADAERVERAATGCAARGIGLLAVRADEVAVTHGADRWSQVVIAGARPPHIPLTPDDDATILYTSGTTGHPKGAVSTHRAVVQALWGFFARTALERARAAGDDATPPSPQRAATRPVFILVVPLFHVTGCIPVMLSCFAHGLKLVMMRTWDPERALELIEREQVTNFVGVPTQSWDLLQSPRYAESDTSTLVGVGGGGAPAPPELVRRVAGAFRNPSPPIG
jgi:long-chain acyl-CoA synthetase